MTREEIADEMQRRYRVYLMRGDDPGHVFEFVCQQMEPILSALRGPDEAAVERAAKVMAMRDSATGDSADDWWEGSTDDYRLLYLDDARAALRAAVTP